MEKQGADGQIRIMTFICVITMRNGARSEERSCRERVSAFRAAFDGFELEKVCAYGEEKIEELCGNKEIIRNRLKIKAAVNNACVFREIQKEYGSFSNYLWHWTKEKVIYENDMVSSPLSDSVSKDLKKRGMKFVGTVIIYSYMQAVGVIYSHEKGCFLEHGKEDVHDRTDT